MFITSYGLDKAIVIPSPFVVIAMKIAPGQHAHFRLSQPS